MALPLLNWPAVIPVQRHTSIQRRVSDRGGDVVGRMDERSRLDRERSELTCKGEGFLLLLVCMCVCVWRHRQQADQVPDCFCTDFANFSQLFFSLFRVCI